MNTEDFLTFFHLNPSEDEEKRLGELRDVYLKLMRDTVKYDPKTGELMNEKDLDEHPATIAMNQYLLGQGYTAERLELIGFPHLAY